MKNSASSNERLMLASQGYKILGCVEDNLWLIGKDHQRIADWLIRTGQLDKILSSNFSNFVSDLFIETKTTIMTIPTGKKYHATHDMKFLLPGIDDRGNYDYDYLIKDKPKKNGVPNYFRLFMNEVLVDDVSLSHRLHKLTSDGAATTPGAYYLTDLLFEAKCMQKPCVEFNIIHAMMIVNLFFITKKNEKFQGGIILPLKGNKPETQTGYHLRAYLHPANSSSSLAGKIGLKIWPSNNAVGVDAEACFILNKKIKA
jgi:hypothetical protein